MKKAISKLKTQQQKSSASVKITPEIIESRKKAFFDWCNSNRIVIHPKIRLEHFDPLKGWGFVSNEPISKDEVLLAVPAEMQLDSESAIKRWPELAKVIVGTDLDEHTTLVLACMIEMLKKDGSKLNPYFDLIRNFVPSSPYFWSHEDLEHLAGTYAAKLLAEDLNVSEHFDRRVLPALKKSKGGLGKLQSQLEDVEYFKKINYFIMSRAFPLGKTSGRLIPGADLFNAKVSDFDAVVSDQPDKKHCVVVATRNIEQNKEIFVTYGTIPNSRLLLRYGYVEENNPYDQVDFDSSLLMDVCGSVREDLTEEQLERIADFCESNADDIGVAINESQLVNADAKPSEELIKLFAIFNLEGEDLEKYLKCTEKSDLATPEKFSSKKTQLEKNVDKCLLLCAVQRLTEYHSTLAEDETLLANLSENFNERCAVILRMSEKRILNALMESIRKKHNRTEQKETVQPKKRGEEESGTGAIAAKKPKKGK